MKKDSVKKMEDFKKDLVRLNERPKELGADEETKVDIEMGIFL